MQSRNFVGACVMWFVGFNSAICQIQIQTQTQTQTQSYADWVFVMNESALMGLDENLINATLSKIPFEVLKGEIAGESTAHEFGTQFHFNPGGQRVPGRLGWIGRPAYMGVSWKGDLSDDQRRQLWQKALDELNGRLAKAVARVQEVALDQQTQQRERLSRQLAEAEEALQKSTHDYIAAQVENSTTVEAILGQRQQLRQRLRELELQIAAAEARKEAIVSQIELMKHTAEAKLADDEISKQLEVIIKGKAARLEQLMTLHRQGNVREVEVLTAESELAKARIELLRHQKSEQDATLARQIAALNDLLSTVIIELAESRELLKYSEREWQRTLNEFEEQLIREQRLESLQSELARNRARVDELQAALRELEGRLAPNSVVRIMPWNE